MSKSLSEMNDAEMFEQVKRYRETGMTPTKILDLLYTNNVLMNEVPRVKKYLLAEADADGREQRIHGIVKGALDSKFKVFCDLRGDRAPLFLSGEMQVSECSDERLISEATHALHSRGILLNARKVKDYVGTWLAKAEALNQLPKSFSLDPTALAFNHVTVELSEMDTPVFDDFIRRCGTNGRAFAAYVWSIFEENDNVQQYVLMRGEGKDGKGSIMRLIEKLVGPRAFAGINTRDSHWVSKLVGKRVGFWPDVNSTAFVMSSEFKQVTGGDSVGITEKYKASYSTRIDAKLFISTNGSAEMTSRKSDLRRAIYVEVAENPLVIEHYEKKLWDERAGVLWKCREAYQALFDRAANEIKCDSDSLKSSAEDFETKFEACLHEHFVTDSNGSVLRAEAYTRTQRNFKHPSEFTQFVSWLRKHYAAGEAKQGGKRVLTGIKLRTP